MENKTARFTVLMDPQKKQAFEKLCASQDLTPSQVVRQLIREYLEKHEVRYLEEGTDTALNPQEKNE
ncbi:CopG family transcriptional regulator [Legionella santicrucis]|uniref:CopG family transcriptional regulator n=1 Tax=Legionella santicrucis TaxID=45074 RepID=A0A0W0Y9H1_9GAMM|nr:CopG family transcriptional regulator [Legionella santicrucis]KTD53219.1 CopG family transcriptional regulator [Legionella santicrucis]